MKRCFEPIAGFLLSVTTWEVWTNLLVSMLVAFLGGALAYLGKWLCAKVIQHFAHRKNVFVSKTREQENKIKTDHE
jgi:membrane protein DedA with SNARE-associated domain